MDFPLLPKDRRAHCRVSAAYRVEYQVGDRGFSCTTGDLSLGGMVLHGVTDLREGDEVEFHIRLGDFETPLVFWGGVVKVRSNARAHDANIAFRAGQDVPEARLRRFFETRIVPALEEVVDCPAPSSSNLVALAALYEEMGRFADAHALYRKGMSVEQPNLLLMENGVRFLLGRVFDGAHGRAELLREAQAIIDQGRALENSRVLNEAAKAIELWCTEPTDEHLLAVDDTGSEVLPTLDPKDVQEEPHEHRVEAVQVSDAEAQELSDDRNRALEVGSDDGTGDEVASWNDDVEQFVALGSQAQMIEELSSQNARLAALLREQTAEAQRLFAVHEHSLEQLKSDLEEKKVQIQSHIETLDSAHQAREEMSSELSSLRAEVQRLRDHLAQSSDLRSQIEHVAGERDTYRKRVRERDEQIAELRAELSAEGEQSTQRFEALQHEHRSIEEMLKPGGNRNCANA